MSSANGMQLVAAAMEAQRSQGYAVDSWIALTLEPMTKVWRGIGGEGAFFFGEEDAREARGAYALSDEFRFAQTLWQLAQVAPNKEMGYRLSIREFVVDIRTPAAVGICRANDRLGSGSVLQYFIPAWDKTLRPTGREHVFANRAFPRR